jgi:hypothetical protein
MNEKTFNTDYIQAKIQNILNKSHNIKAKTEIKRFPSEKNPDRLNFSCPICGDSQKSIYKKRGNLYMDNLRFKCFNCGETMTFTKFCDTFNEPIDMEQRISIYKYIDENTHYNKTDDYILEEMDKLIEYDDFINYFNTKKNSWLYDIKPVEQNSHVYQYLKYERLITDFSRILQGVYRVIREGKTVFETRVMISMNMTIGDVKKVLGIQIRNLESNKDKRFYKIVEFEEIYNYIHPTELLDEIEAISYNKLSHFYNILNVDFESTVTIFEGFLDSLFYPNSIGMVGAKNDEDLLRFLTESDENLSLRFFYDNDITGISKATKMLNKGFPVFLWNKLFEILSKQINNKNKSKKILKNIIDLNDLVKVSKNPNIYKTLKLENNFSVDKFDLIYLPKIIYNKELSSWIIQK